MTSSANVVQKSLFIYDPGDKKNQAYLRETEEIVTMLLASRVPYRKFTVQNKFRYFYLRHPDLGLVQLFLASVFKSLDETVLISDHLSTEVKHRLIMETRDLHPVEYFAHWHLFESWISCFGYILSMAKDPQKSIQINYILERIEEIIAGPFKRHSVSGTLEDLCKSLEADIAITLPPSAPLPDRLLSQIPFTVSLSLEHEPKDFAEGFMDVRRKVRTRMAELSRFLRHVRIALQDQQPQYNESFYNGPSNELSTRFHPPSLEPQVMDPVRSDIPSIYLADSEYGRDSITTIEE